MSSLWKMLRSLALQGRALTDANTGFWAIRGGVRGIPKGQEARGRKGLASESKPRTLRGLHELEVAILTPP